MSTPSEHPPILTVPEIAKRLRIGRTSAYRLCEDPGFPAIRVRGQIRVPVEALESWMLNASNRTVREEED